MLSLLDFIVNNPKYIWALISLLGVIGLMISVIRAHFSRNNQFDLIKLFAFDNSTGKLSDSKVRINAAFVTTTWAFVFLTMNDKLTEWYVAVYLAAWVADRFSARNSNKEIVKEGQDGNSK